MFVRGSNNAQEYKRNDTSFYKGIVVKNNDPLKLHRLKIYIPELSNQPLEGWLKEYKRLNMRFPGTNNTNDVWQNADIFEEISNYLPWAEPCFPLFGEGAPARYQSPEQLAVLTDSDYEEGFETNNTEPPTVTAGSFSPSYLYENYETTVTDFFANPKGNFAVKNNPYSYLYRPSSHVNKSKGIFSVPSIGTKVWLFHYNGDINFPVYIGTRHDYRETMLINDMNNEDQLSLDYPGVFENKKKENE